jgi:hypothetical protein
MGRDWRSGWIMMCLCAVVGCSGSPTEPAGPMVPSDPAALSAYEFFDAVLKGDTQRASSRLTPLAMQRIIERGEQFAPPGDDGAVGFRVGQVIRPNPTEALVQCILTEAAADQGQRDTEVICLLRLVEGQWRVSGIAHTSGPKQVPMILDFETGRHMPVPQPGTQQAPSHLAARPSSPPAAGTPASSRQ